MPQATAATFDHENKNPIELENRRRELTGLMTTKYRGYDDPSLPEEILTELAVITMMLRRKTAGPPKVATVAGKKVSRKAVLSDLEV